MTFKNIPLKGSLLAQQDLPGDKSISHRALIFAALAQSSSSIDGLNQGQDVLNTQHTLEAIGVSWLKKGSILKCQGRPSVWQSPSASIDLGNSGTSARLLTGLMAALPLQISLKGDDSLSRRPMERVITPLQKMGAIIQSASGKQLPLAIDGQSLVGSHHYLTVPSAQLKSALLIAGMLARGKTTIQGNINSRDHTERLMDYFHIPFHQTTQELSLIGPVTFKGRSISIPADPSAAAFFAVAALIVPHSHIHIIGMNWNPYRRQAFDVLRKMGGHIQVHLQENVCGEPVANIKITASNLRGIETTPEQAPALIDEFPILCIAAAHAQGRSVFRGLAELRFKESDRLQVITDNLRRCGYIVEIHGDDLHILGSSRASPLTIPIKTHQDHRIAMSFAILNLVYPGQILLDDVACIKTSFPKFFDCLTKLQQS